MARLGRARPVVSYRPTTRFPPLGSPQTADSIDTTVTADLSSTATITRNADASTAVTAGLTAAATITRNADASTVVTVGLTAAATITRNAAAATTVTAGLTAAADRTTVAAGSTTVTAGLTAAADRMTVADGPTTVVVGLTAAASRATVAAATTMVTVGLTADATTGSPPIDSSLVVAVGLTASASVSTGINGSTTVTAGLTAAATRTANAAASTTVVAGLTASAARATTATASTTVSVGLTAAATVVARVDAGLAISVGLTASATVHSAVGALLKRGISPSTIVRGSDGAYAIAVYFGHVLVWDGTRPVMVQVPVARGSGIARGGLAATGAIGVASTATGSGAALQAIPVVPGIVVAPTASGSGTTPTPTVNVVAEVATPPAVGAGSMPAPGVLVTDNAIAIHVTATGNGVAPAPTAVVDAVVAAPTATGSGLAPMATGGVATTTVSPAATGSGLASPPTPKASVLFAAPTALGTGIAVSPLPIVPTTKTAVTATGSGLAPAPSIPAYINIIDTFNRSNGGVGAAYTALLNGGPVIVNNRAQGGTSGPVSVTSSYAVASNTPYATATQEVSQYIIQPIGTPRNFALGSVAWLRGTTDGQSCVGVMGTQSGTNGSVHTISIVSYTAGVATVRASTTSYYFDQAGVAGNVPAPTKLGLRAVGNVYTAVLFDIPTTLTWTDTGNIVSQANRTWGFECRTSENAGGTPTYAQAIAQVEARDYLGIDWVDTNVYQRPTWGSIITNFTYYSGDTQKFHNGIDILGAAGRNIYAIANGVVDIVDSGHTANDGSTWGNALTILHTGEYLSAYGHLTTINVTAGQTVTRGQIIGTMGNTGNAGSYHLHFSIIRGTSVNDIGDPWIMDLPAPPGQFPYQDPQRFLASRGVALSWGTAL